MKRSAVAIALLVAASIGITLWYFQSRHRAGSTAVASAPIPVIVANVAGKDVPIYLAGLGTVQASNTVTVTAQVEGVLEKVSFLEGQRILNLSSFAYGRRAIIYFGKN